MKKRLLFALRLIVTFVLPFYIIASLDIGGGKGNLFSSFISNSKFIIVKISCLSTIWILIFFLTLLIASFASIYRWWMLLCAHGFQINFIKSAQYIWIARFFDNILPSIVGGDVVLGWFIWRDSEQKKEAAVVTVLLNRLLAICGLYSIAVFASFFLFKDPILKRISIFVSIGFVLLIIFFIFLFQKKWFDLVLSIKKLPFKNSLQTLYNAFYYYRNKKMAVFLGYLAALVVNGFEVFANYEMALALGIKGINPFGFFLMVPLGIFIGSLPVSLGGLGVREFAYKEMLKTIGIIPAEAVTISLVYRLVLIVFTLALGIPSYLLYGYKKIKVTNPQ
jgi:glycosyltransferase 2 family protein